MAATLAPDVEQDWAQFLELKLEQHARASPVLSPTLNALIMYVLADFPEKHREAVQQAMYARNISFLTLTPRILRDLIIDVVCAPRSALGDPTLSSGVSLPRASVQHKSFLLGEYGDLEGYPGFWALDEDAGEQGFLADDEDVFWLYDHDSSFWVREPFKERRVSKGTGKGKGSGKKGSGVKGAKGKSFFKPRPFFWKGGFTSKNKGKGFSEDAHLAREWQSDHTETWEENKETAEDVAAAATPKPQGKAKSKGKRKGKAKGNPSQTFEADYQERSCSQTEVSNDQVPHAWAVMPVTYSFVCKHPGLKTILLAEHPTY
ncbi:MAG: hypothetical protein AAGJ35_14585, partial [Myxococcota bacterium]